MEQEFDLPTPPPYVQPPQSGDDSTKRMGMIAAAIGGGLLVLTAAWSFRSHGSGDVPYIEADHTPVRVAPADPGGMEFSGAAVDTGGSENGHLEPEAETPDLALLHQRMKEGNEPKQVAPAARETTSAAQDPGQTPDIAVDEAPTTEKPAAPPRVDSEKHSAVRKEPPHREAAKKDPAKKEPAKDAIKEKRKEPTPLAIGHSGHIQVQLTAAASEEAARAEWARLKRVSPGTFAGKEPQITKVERNGKAYYRLRTSGFTDMSQATGFCSQLASKHATCSVANF